MRSERYGIVILLLLAVHLFGVVGPLFLIGNEEGNCPNQVAIKQLGGLSGVMTVVCGDVSQTLRTVVDAGCLLSTLGKRQVPAGKAKKEPMHKAVVLYVVLDRLELSRIVSVSDAYGSLLTQPLSVNLILPCLSLVFLGLLCVHRCTLSKWRTALARGSIDDSIIKSIVYFHSRTLIGVPSIRVFSWIGGGEWC